MPEQLTNGLKVEPFLYHDQENCVVDPASRIRLAERLAQLPFTHKELFNNKNTAQFEDQTLMDNEFLHIRSKANPDQFVFRSAFDEQGRPDSGVTIVSLVEVYINKPWRIEAYNGFERIEYHAIPEILDADLNYANW